MATPRFQFVPGGRLLGQHEVGRVGWRLLGANNRELGRSAVAYVDAEAAHDGIDRVRELAQHGISHIVLDGASGLWMWHVYDDEVAVAHSGRGFRHERECRYNLAQFREAAPTAPISDSLIPQQFTGVVEASDVATAGGAA